MKIIKSVFMISMLMGCFGVAVHGGWEWTYPVPQGNPLAGAWAYSESEIYAVGEAGIIVHFDGTLWSTVYHDQNTLMQDVWGSSPDNVFAVGYHDVGYGGVIVHYDGTSWTVQTGEEDNVEFLSVWGTSPTEVWAYGHSMFYAGDTVWRWDGSSWSEVHSELPIRGYDFWGTGPDNLYIVGTEIILHWDGVAWTEMPQDITGDITGIWGTSDDSIYVCTSESANSAGSIHYWDGTEWTQIYHENNKKLFDISGSNSSNVIACGYNGTIIHVNGIQVLDRSFEDGMSFKAVCTTGQNSAVIAGGSGTLVKWDGTQWTYIVKGFVGNMLGIWGFGPNDVFAGGDYWYDDEYSSRIVRWNGSTWNNLPTGVSMLTVYCVWGAASDNVYAAGIQGAGSDGYLIHWNGVGWSHIDLGTPGQHTGIWGTSASDIFLVGEEIFHFNGTDWTEMTSGEYWHLKSVWGFAPDDVYAVGASGLIVHYDGMAWTQIPYAEHPEFRDVWGTGPDNVYVTGDQRILRYDGVEWQKVYNDTYFLGRSIWGTGPDNIYAASETSGRIVHYDGTEWTIMNVPNLRRSGDMWGCSAEDIFVTVQNGILRLNGNDPTPTPVPSQTPEPTQAPSATPMPTMTPTPIIDDYGTTLAMPSHYFSPGDPCRLKVFLINKLDPLTEVPLFVILQIYDDFWFWPSWNDTGDFRLEDLPSGSSEMTILESFQWPDTGTAELDNIIFWSGMTNPEMTDVLGGVNGVGQWVFGFGPAGH